MRKTSLFPLMVGNTVVNVSKEAITKNEQHDSLRSMKPWEAMGPVGFKKRETVYFLLSQKVCTQGRTGEVISVDCIVLFVCTDEGTNRYED